MHGRCCFSINIKKNRVLCDDHADVSDLTLIFLIIMYTVILDFKAHKNMRKEKMHFILLFNVTNGLW